MKSAGLFQFEDDQTLSPTKLNSNFKQIQGIFDEAESLRYNRFDFKLDFSGVDESDSSAIRRFYFDFPFSVEIEFIELYLYHATGSLTSVTLTSSLTNFEDVTLAPLGATTKSVKFKEQHCVTSGSGWFGLDFTGTGTLTTCYAIVHCKVDRFSGAVVSRTSGKFQVSAGDEVSATALDAEFSNCVSDAEDVAADNLEKRVIELYVRRNFTTNTGATAGQERFIIPANGRTFERMQLFSVSPLGTDVTADFKTNSATAVGIDTSTTAEDETILNDSQPTNDPDDSTDDDQLTITRSAGAGTVNLAYVWVIYV